MKLIDRLIFGTARLAGGGCAGASRQLIEDCCAAGLMRFDTAPSYGMGAAEQLLGEVVGSAQDAVIHTKAGFSRPAAPTLRGWAKHVSAMLPASSSAAWQPKLLEYRKPASAGQYETGELRQSIDRSRKLLRRETLDLLLLHAAEPEDIPQQSWEVFTDAKRTGSTRQIGFAHTGPAKNAGHGLVVQIAARAAHFTKPSDTPLIFHSIRTSAAIEMSRGGEAAGALIAARERLGTSNEGATSDLVTALYVLAAAQPNAQLIFATTSRPRLHELLAEAAAIELPGQIG